MDLLQLSNLRSRLIRQEETIIFGLIERAQFALNDAVYRPGAINVPNFDGSFLDYLLWETEKLHAKVRRYTSPDEHSFFADLPAPILPRFDYSCVLIPNTINLNTQVLLAYKQGILPLICDAADDGNYGSSATCDVSCLQALSKRVHYGKFVAEAKYRTAPAVYDQLVADGDRDGIVAELRDVEVEANLLRRVEEKAMAYGQDIGTGDVTNSTYKIPPATIAEVYRQWLIPLTIEVEVQYLQLARDGIISS